MSVVYSYSALKRAAPHRGASPPPLLHTVRWLSTPEILESGDIKAFVHANDPRDLEFLTEDVNTNWPQELENKGNVTDTPYNIMIRGINVESKDLYNLDSITKVIEELVGLNASRINSLTTPDDIRDIYWYKDYRPGSRVACNNTLWLA